MRIVFICSSLEPGRDGVGDYTRRLAGELIRQGHECRIVALNDKHQTQAQAEVRSQKSEVRDVVDFVERQESEGTTIECLRLPDSLRWHERVTMARKWVDAFNPDWLSLQYVCYGYHPKGLAWRWNRIFAELGNMATHRHLMLHELWIGPPPFHRRFIGMGQRWVVRDLHRCFRPDIVTTSMALYQRRLARQKIAARVLPLFGNIPFASRDDDRIAGLLRAAGSSMVQKSRATYINGIFFGGVHPDLNAMELIQWLGELQSNAGKTILLNMIGRGGAAAEHLVHKLKSLASDTIEVVMLGERSEETISQALQFADFGINTGSSKFLWKSGTFAAMQEHGLPVVLPNGELDSTMLRNGTPPVLQFSTKDSITTVMNYASFAHKKTGVADTAAKLICIFEKATIV